MVALIGGSEKRWSPGAGCRGKGLQLHLWILAEERAKLHLLRRGLEDRPQGWGQAK